jgi:predicted MPP superfamily phosphohydrolase
MISRRQFILGAGGFAALSALGTSAYAVGIEPELLDVTTYRLIPRGWPPGHNIRICVIADIHACEPWMSASRIRDIALLANSMKPDLTVLLGDFHAGHNYVTGPVMPDRWGEALSVLRAPLGVYSILGNHDMLHGPLPKMDSDEGESVRAALKGANIRLLENNAIRLVHNDKPFWLLGLGDQMAYEIGRGRYRGLDDLKGTLAQVHDDAPALLLAHEPHIFRRVPQRIALTLCGHTHGGQINLPIIGAALRRHEHNFKHIYGYVNENGQEMIISAGLGNSIVPVRIGRPPEILDIHLG